jgi:uncharacterized protein
VARQQIVLFGGGAIVYANGYTFPDYNDTWVYYSASSPATMLSSAQVSTTASGLGYSRVSKTFVGSVTITNVSGSTINGPFQIVFASLTGGVTLSNASSVYNGSPYITISVSNLAAGQSSVVSVQFSNPSSIAIDFSPVIYSGSFN